MEDSDLPEGDVLVDVAYSSLNYKDGLAVTGLGKIIRQFPMVPGIDFAGVVRESAHPDYEPGDEVILTGWGVAKIIGAVWPRVPESRVTGWCLCHWVAQPPSR